MRPGRSLLLVLLGALLVGVALTYSAFRNDMAQARDRIAAFAPETVETALGPVTFVETGRGIPVLSIHGTGGGYDQGADIAADFFDRGWRVISPSRFGYLGAEVPERTDAAAQADAFAALLDALEIEGAVVMGTSAGAVTALHFAERHPERTLALLAMVPAYFPPEQAAPEPWSPLREWAVTRALRSDFLFWVGLKLAPDSLASAVLATDRAILDAVNADERARLHGVLSSILPISARADGLLLDAGHTASPVPVDLAGITLPTLAASAEDDRYRTADSARLIAAGVKGSALFVTPDGGHVWAGRQAELGEAVASFLRSALDQ